MPGGLFAYGGQGDTWNGLAHGNLNMNGYLITNINTVSILQTSTTGQALEVHRNLAAASTDAPVVCFYNDHAADDQGVLMVVQNSPYYCVFVDQDGDGYGVLIDSEATTSNLFGLNVLTGQGATCAQFQYSGNEYILLGQTNSANGSSFFYRNLAAASTAGAVVYIRDASATDDQAALGINQEGLGGGILLNMTLATGGIGIDIDHDADNYGVRITSAATTNTMYGIQVLTGSGATVANFEYSGSEFARLGMHDDANGSFWFYRNLEKADTSGPVVKIHDNHKDDDQGALHVLHDGDASVANSIVKFETTNVTNDQFLLDLVNVGNNYCVNIAQSGDATAAYILMTGDARALKISHTDTGILESFHIDRNGDNAADIWAIKLNCDNAGAGVPGGVNMTSFSAGEALLGVPVDANVIGATYGRMAVYVNGVGIKYLEVFDLPE